MNTFIQQRCEKVTITGINYILKCIKEAENSIVIFCIITVFSVF